VTPVEVKFSIEVRKEGGPTPGFPNGWPLESAAWPASHTRQRALPWRQKRAAARDIVLRRFSGDDGDRERILADPDRFTGRSFRDVDRRNCIAGRSWR